MIMKVDFFKAVLIVSLFFNGDVAAGKTLLQANLMYHIAIIKCISLVSKYFFMVIFSCL